MNHITRICLIVVAIVFTPTQGHAGIPTTDPGQLSGIALDLAGKAVQYGKVITEAQRRYQKLKDSLDRQTAILGNISGERFLGTFGRDAALRLTLPDDWADMYQQFNDLTNIVLPPEAQDVYEDIYETLGCENMTFLDDKNVCTRRAARQANDEAILTLAIRGIDERLVSIDGLMDKINTVTVQKEMEALLGRIAAEQASLQAENMKLNMYMTKMENNKQLDDQRAQEERNAIYKSYGTLTPDPIVW